MKIRYVYDQLLPSRDTDTEQVLNTVSALGLRGVNVTLAVPQLPNTPPVQPEALRSYYQVGGPFQVELLPALVGAPRPVQKAAHGLRASRASADADLTYTRNLHAVAFALKFGQRVVYEHFRPWADQYPPMEPLLVWMFRHPNFLGAVLHSRHIVESYTKVGLSEAELLVAHNGYQPARMQPRLEPMQARGSLELPSKGALVVYAGRVHERKGLLTVLDLARLLPHVTFVIVGSEGEGRVEREARALSNVIVRPWQRFDVTVRYLYAADALIIPPTLEPLENHGNTVLPMKLFQYLASGRPIFAPVAPDTAELLLHDETAVLVQPGDPLAQARELHRLLEDPERRARIGGGAMRAAAALTWDARAEKIEAFIVERLEARRHRAGSAKSLQNWDVARWLRSSARWLGERTSGR